MVWRCAGDRNDPAAHVGGRRIHVLSGVLDGTGSQPDERPRLYRAWRWSTTPADVRAVGMAGASVAVADYAGAAFLNPAGIGTLEKSEASVSLLAAQAGNIGSDVLGSWTGVSSATGAARLSKRTAIAGYYLRPRAGRVDLSPAVRLPNGSTNAGYLDSTLTDVGGAIARRIGARLSVGLRLTATHLELEALQSRSTSAGVVDLETGSGAGDTRITASLGLLYEAGEAGRLRMGVVVQQGASYKVERTARRPALGGIDQGSLYEVRAPGLVAIGAALRVNRYVLVSGQVDYVRYSEIEAFVRPGGAASGEYAIQNALEPRVGAEVSLPFGGASLQLRSGAHVQAPGSFIYRGPDMTEAAAFGGTARRVIGAAGASLVLGGGFAFEVAGTTGGDRSELAAGARFRF